MSLDDCQYDLLESHAHYLSIDVDEQIIREQNNDVKHLAQELEDIVEATMLMNNLVYDQGYELEDASDHVDTADIYVEGSVQDLEQAGSLKDKLRGWMAKGALVSTGVTGAGAVAGVFLSPIVGGVGVVLGLGGMIFCIFQMK